METSLKIPVGISLCLLGERVRYDGGHKLSRVCTELLGRHFDYRPFCPEVAAGLGVPRPPIHLVASDRGLRALGVGGRDFTRALLDYADSVTEQVRQLSGFILMERSPSCGLVSTPRHRSAGGAAGEPGAGLFAGRLREHFPDLPMEEAGRLRDPDIRERFIERVFAYHSRFR